MIRHPREVAAARAAFKALYSRSYGEPQSSGLCHRGAARSQIGYTGAARLTPEDRRALSPLFWTHINPYGRFFLNMDTRLDLNRAA